ncbi:programmed cell death protein 7 [Stegastes partitus]|uniref:Programmed cell death 7 n=1 Tax=Stegastes partitus TaxID=144197 RepID=A0A3B5ASV8_9TELE|nr:PREDICTED: programmed cell death protein 7 [Stegastes partitus]
MDSTYQHAFPDTQQPPVFGGGYMPTPYTANRPRPGSGQEHPAPPWTPSPAYDGHSYGPVCNFPAPPPQGAGFGGPRFDPPYEFDHSNPPPPFGCPFPPHFSGRALPVPVNAYSSPGVSTLQTFSQCRAAPPTPLFDCESVSDCNQKRYEDRCEAGVHLSGPLGPTPRQDCDGSLAATQPEDESTLQRRHDTQWLRRFLPSRGKAPRSIQTQQSQLSSVSVLRAALHRAAQLVSQLEKACQSLKESVHDDGVWTDSYLTTLHVRRELQDNVSLLSDAECLDRLKVELSRIVRGRARRMRAKRKLQIEKKDAEERSSDKDAAIDIWRMKKIRQVEEKKKEHELKLAADSVLCEVRKKQTDVKRMQDVLRSLEKLRKLRKEAASRKGVVTEQCDQAFSSRLQQLRCVMKRRTAVYAAEEKALMVMLEGEQEEERRREQRRRVKKEKERQLQRKRTVDSMLFGEELPAGCVLQPFTEYYRQAEHSEYALIQVRREWDMFVVAADHPDGSSIPQSWILPDPPSDQAWASALQTADTDCYSL